MASHAAGPAPDQPAPDSGHHAPCQCLDHCRCCPGAALPALRLGLGVVVPFETGISPAAPSRAIAAARTPYQLPFATAPPAAA